MALRSWSKTPRTDRLPSKPSNVAEMDVSAIRFARRNHFSGAFDANCVDMRERWDAMA